VVGVNDNLGALVLQANGGVDDETLGAADAQVRVEEDVAAGDGLGDVFGNRLVAAALLGLGVATGVFLAEGLAGGSLLGAHLALGLLRRERVRGAGLRLVRHGGFVWTRDGCRL